MPHDRVCHARLIETVAAPLAAGSADAPDITHGLLVQRGDAELVVRGETEVRFPAPWPRRYGSVAVSPAADLVVFAGVHALRAVDAAGAVRWEVRHGCWSAAVCTRNHASFAEYADDPRHERADTGSAAFSPDGKFVWAHVRNYDGAEIREEWLVLDPADGAVLARTDTGTVGSGSFHFPLPDPARMALTVGEGEEDSPVLMGRLDGGRLAVERFVEEVFLAISPSGERFLTTDPGQWSVYVHRTADGAELGEWKCDSAVPPPAGSDRVFWDFEAAFPHEDTAVLGTESHAPEPRHWCVDPSTVTVRGRIAYPFPIAGAPRSAGSGRWHTVAPDGSALHFWALAD
ncbi:hypothetical protein GCM10010492_48420 [Saccharothrix mutabilis subsp. mutabilis]|uniref:WD40 repeat domain-containing protein n=1 Tax=Saccharothrix mutabilis subsp. mutabilis TaxID=66855 RepID=A0ABN0U9U0_9PSEU